MKRRPTVRIKLLLAGVVAVSVALILVLMFARHDRTASPIPEPRPAPEGLSTAAVYWSDQLLEIVREDTPVSLVQFETALWRGPKTPIPATGLGAGLSAPGKPGDVLFNVEGRFRLLQNLHLNFTNWGSVKRGIPLNLPPEMRPESGMAMWPGGCPFPKLKPLLAATAEKPSISLLVVLSPYTNSPADGTFFGPLTPADLAWLPECIAAIAAEPARPMSPERARQLLASPNPWLGSLALSQLKEARALSGQDFVAQFAARCPEEADRVLGELCVVANNYNRAFWDEITPAVSAMMRTPGREVLALKTINEWLPKDFVGLRTKVKLRDLEIGAREYRKTIPEDADHRELRQELDKLIRFILKILDPVAGGNKRAGRDEPAS